MVYLYQGEKEAGRFTETGATAGLDRLVAAILEKAAGQVGGRR